MMETRLVDIDYKVVKSATALFFMIYKYLLEFLNLSINKNTQMNYQGLVFKINRSFY